MQVKYIRNRLRFKDNGKSINGADFSHKLLASPMLAQKVNQRLRIAARAMRKTDLAPRPSWRLTHEDVEQILNEIWKVASLSGLSFERSVMLFGTDNGWEVRAQVRDMPYDWDCSTPGNFHVIYEYHEADHSSGGIYHDRLGCELEMLTIELD